MLDMHVGGVFVFATCAVVGGVATPGTPHANAMGDYVLGAKLEAYLEERAGSLLYILASTWFHFLTLACSPLPRRHASCFPSLASSSTVFLDTLLMLSCLSKRLISHSVRKRPRNVAVLLL